MQEIQYKALFMIPLVVYTFSICISFYAFFTFHTQTINERWNYRFA